MLSPITLHLYLPSLLKLTMHVKTDKQPTFPVTVGTGNPNASYAALGRTRCCREGVDGVSTLPRAQVQRIKLVLTYYSGTSL